MILTPTAIVRWVQEKFDGVVVKDAFSELTFFYNPGHRLPNGVYFLTIKENDGPNDKASALDREGVFRISFKPEASTYQRHFGVKPKRASKGGLMDTGVDYSALDTWLPHPIYAWMGWTMILNPTRERFEFLMPFIEESYVQAQNRFLKRFGGSCLAKRKQ